MAVFMRVTSALMCRVILLRFCSGEFFLTPFWEQHYTLSDGKHNNKKPSFTILETVHTCYLV